MQTLIASSGVSTDQFGTNPDTLLFSPDSTVLVVGAPGRAGVGAVYVFSRIAGVSWAQSQVLTPSDGTSDAGFGLLASLFSSDSTTLFVSAIGQSSNAGAVYVFARSGSTWTQLQKLTAGDSAPGTGFGTYLSLSPGNASVLAVGAYQANSHFGATYIFARSAAGLWAQAQELVPNGGSVQFFGDCITFSLTGSTLVSSAPYSNGVSGSAFVYTQQGGSPWQQAQVLAASDGSSYSYFGEHVVFSPNNTTLVVGAVTAAAGVVGAAYVFKQVDGVWTQTQELLASPGSSYSYFGHLVVFSPDGSMLMIAGPYTNSNAGAVYVFQLSGGLWIQSQVLTNSDGTSLAGSNEGNSLSFTPDSRTLTITGHVANGGAGVVVVFTCSGSVWTQAQELSGGPSIQNFGGAMTVAPDGSALAVSAVQTSSSTGIVYVYSASGCSPGTACVGAGCISCAPCPAGTKSTSFNALTCSVCPIGSYSYGGSSSCSICPSGAALVSSTSGCAPSPALTPGPTSGLAFYLSGSSAEGVAAFPTFVAPAGLSYTANVFGAPASALNLSAGSYLAAIPSAGSALAAALPAGNAQWSASAWVNCPAPPTNAAVLEWGAAGDGQGISPQTAALIVSSGEPAPSGGIVATLAGSGNTGSADGPGASASFYLPSSIALMPSGDSVVIADQYNHRIRLVTLSGLVSTLAGSGNGAFADGVGVEASFYYPWGVAVIPSNGVVVVSDQWNGRIRLISPAGVTSTLAGSSTGGSADGIGTAASFNALFGLAVNPANNNIYVADTGNNILRLVTYPDGVVTTLAGSGDPTFADGAGAAAGFNNPTDVAFIASSGLIVVADQLNNRVRLVSLAGVVTTLVGSGSAAFADGTGTAASFSSPGGVAVVSAAGLIAVGDSNNNRIRLVTPQGVVTTLAGSSNAAFADGVGTAASMSGPSGLVLDLSGSSLIVADQFNNRIRTISLPLSAALPACDSTWHHVALTYAPAPYAPFALSAYLDGALVSQQNATIMLPPASSSTLRVGWSGSLATNGGSIFTGALSELRIYNRTLSSPEVLVLSQPVSVPTPVVVVEQSCSVTSAAIPSGSGLFFLPAAASGAGLDLIVTDAATCAARAAAGTGVRQCNVTGPSFLASDNSTVLFTLGTAASLNMRATEQLSCVAAATAAATTPVSGLTTILGGDTSVDIASAHITASAVVVATLTLVTGDTAFACAPAVATLISPGVGFTILLQQPCATPQTFAWIVASL